MVNEDINRIQQLVEWLHDGEKSSVRNRNPLNIEPTLENLDTWLALAKERGFDQADLPFEFNEKQGKKVFEEFRKLGEAAQNFMTENSSKVAWGINVAGDLAFASTMIMAGLQEGQYGRVISPMVSQVLNILPVMFPEEKEKPEGPNALVRLLKSYNPSKYGGLRTYLLGNAVSCLFYTLYTVNFAIQHHEPKQAVQAIIGALLFIGVINGVFGDKSKTVLPTIEEKSPLNSQVTESLTNLIVRKDISLPAKIKYLSQVTLQSIFSPKGSLVGGYVVESLKLAEGLGKADGKGMMLIANAVISSILSTVRTYVFVNAKTQAAQKENILSLDQESIERPPNITSDGPSGSNIPLKNIQQDAPAVTLQKAAAISRGTEPII